MKNELNLVRLFFICLSLSLFSLIHVSPLYAKPLTFSGTTKKSPPFPKNSVLNVFIQPDPKGQGRDELLKEGVERWKKSLADRMITLNVTIGTPPQGTTNPITYKWSGDGMLGNGMELGPGKNDGVAQPKVSQDGKSLVGGEALIRNGLPADTDKQKDTLRNVGEHELTHILGIADTPKGAVTKHEQSDAGRKLNDEDLKELNSLYGTANTGGAGKPQGIPQLIDGSSGEGFFTYQFDFVPANALSDPADPEHIALIALGIAPQLVQGVELPPGWISLIPDANLSINDPFFSEGYMIDGAPDPTPWDFAPQFIAFRVSELEAFKDGLPEDFDPALSLNNPSLKFKIMTLASVDGPIEIWSGGELQTITGPVIPEPSTFMLFGVGLLALRKRGLTHFL